MPSTSSPIRSDEVSSCRRCRVFCDRVVYPGGCLESGCSRLYAYDHEGRTYVGCLEKVFRVEIDLEALRRAEGSRPGFGALKVAREPLAICRTDVHEAFRHRGNGPCVNPDFLFSSSDPLRVTSRRPSGAA